MRQKPFAKPFPLWLSDTDAENFPQKNFGFMFPSPGFRRVAPFSAAYAPRAIAVATKSAKGRKSVVVLATSRAAM